MRTFGVEEEFLLATASSPVLAAAGDAVTTTAAAASDGQFEHEFKQQQAELGTRPTESVAELGAELRQRRAELASAACAHGARLLACGTSPLDQRVTTTPGPRYERMTDLFGRVARISLTCGMHVHVSVESPAEGVAILDGIRSWLPVVLALSANSPFFAGEDTGYASYRTILWGQWPTAGAADPFGDVEGYERARSALVASGAAMDDGMIYFDARLSSRYPTVEVRVADVCLDVDDAATIAAIVRGLCASAAGADRPAPARGELLRAASWQAARSGVEQQLVDVEGARTVPAWNLVDRLIDFIRPALRATGDADRVGDGLDEIRRRGTGSARQRAAYANGGAIDSVIDTVAALTTR